MPQILLNQLQLHIYLIGIIVWISSDSVEEVINKRTQCRGPIVLTSPNYPESYPNSVEKRWYVTGPFDRRLLASFNDFKVDVSDGLSFIDPTDRKNNEIYRGGYTFPPFLSMGNRMEILFDSNRNGRRRGFNISISCLKEKSSIQLVEGGSPLEGFVRSGPDELIDCGDAIDSRTWEVICRENGYPGVNRIHRENVSISQNQASIKAPRCSKYHYRLVDCEFNDESCILESAARIKVVCQNPGYLGCYDIEGQRNRNTSIGITNVSSCVSSCRRNDDSQLALLQGRKCSCLRSHINLDNLPTDNDKCKTDFEGEWIAFDFWTVVYNVSVGFCDQPDDVQHGQWDSNITWFGSILTLFCDAGYETEGCNSIQCVPGESTYRPVWNDSFPSCQQVEENASLRNGNTTLSPSTGETHGDGSSKSASLDVALIYPTTVLFIFLLMSVLLHLFCFLKNDREETSAVHHTYLEFESFTTKNMTSGETDAPAVGDRQRGTTIGVTSPLSADILIEHMGDALAHPQIVMNISDLERNVNKGFYDDLAPYADSLEIAPSSRRPENYPGVHYLICSKQ